jgi:hypothetical protein
MFQPHLSKRQRGVFLWTKVRFAPIITHKTSLVKGFA